MDFFEEKNYSIKERLPEWWRDDLFLSVVNDYSAKLITDILKEFLSSLALKQPWMVWKKLPEENNWEYHYKNSNDSFLGSHNDDPDCNGTTNLNNNKIICKIPNTKRNCHGYVKIQLNSFLKNNSKSNVEVRTIKQLFVKNGNQIIELNDIKTSDLIEIFTEEQTVLINKNENQKKVKGFFNIIQSEAIVTDESELKKLPIYDENKKTQIEIYSPENLNCHCDIFVKVFHPVYVTEQNVRLWSPSAFPLESVQLYGYFCHEHNFNEGWALLFEKKYSIDEKIVYDRFTKEFDVEIFYIKVKYYGIDIAIKVGFPQEETSSDPAFETNKKLDSWGNVLSLPRRYYKTDIDKNRERYTFPKYYPYQIEQDYYYEKRMLNEYLFNQDGLGSIFIEDTDGQNIAMVDVIDPYVEDLYLYTETIPQNENANQTIDCSLNSVNVIKAGAEWSETNNIQNIKFDNKSFSEVTLNPKANESIMDKTYLSDLLDLEFDIPDNLRNDIKINGLELIFQGQVSSYVVEENMFDGVLQISSDSNVLIPYTDYIDEDTKVPVIKYEKVDILADNFWETSKTTFKLGGKDYVFSLPDDEPLTKRQLDLEHKLKFKIGFTNESEKNKLHLKISNVKLRIHYEILKESLDPFLKVDKNKLTKGESFGLSLSITNNGDVVIKDKDVFLLVPNNFYIIDSDNTTNKRVTSPIRLSLPKIDIGDKISLTDIADFSVKNSSIIYNDSIRFYCEDTGLYDVKLICDDIIKEENIQIIF